MALADMFCPLNVAYPSGLPDAGAPARAHGELVEAMLRERIAAAGGWLEFSHWMQAALYAPGLGYYSAGSTKLAGAGDFTTAPELGSLFAQALARQVAEVLRASDSLQVLEFGAGSGALAADLLAALDALGLEVQYQIIELSADLRARQAERLAPWGARVSWLAGAPAQFSGCVVANEVLDAMPATLFCLSQEHAIGVLGVVCAPGDAPQNLPFGWQARRAAPALEEIIAPRVESLPAGYCSELNLPAEAWVRELGGWLVRGAALLIDYGFPQHEYYHPQRSRGSLMCHFRHHAHDQPLILAGLQDITTHVDFTAMADAALAAGLDVLGYTSQARFLLNCGLLDVLAQPQKDPARASKLMVEFNTLTSEAEMGELFKILAIGRDLDTPLLGFGAGDRRHRL